MNVKLFGAPWCVNCKTIKTFLESRGINVVEMEGADQRIESGVLYINTDNFMEVAKDHSIRSLPTMITDNNDRIVGLQSIMDYVNNIA